jgi:hypothetical protein
MLDACYTLMNAPAVTHTRILQPQIEQTTQAVLQHQGLVLYVHDITELDFSGHTTLHKHLGQIGEGHGFGYLCLNSLAIDPTNRQVFGLLGQILHKRPQVSDTETTAQKRDRANRESRLWLQATPPLSSPSSEYLRIDIIDRAGDTFEFMAHEAQEGRHYVQRVYQDRNIRTGHDGRGLATHLLPYLRSLPAVAQRSLTVSASRKAPARQAQVSMAWVPLRLQPPKVARGEYPNQPLVVWAIRIWETDAAADVVEPVEWFLVTNVEVSDTATAWQRADWYSCRPIVEDYHKAQKTGCDIELPQFETVEALEPMIALLSVVAVWLLQLREASRDPEVASRSATNYMHREFVAMLAAWRYGQDRPLTVKEFFLALARLGGHQNRKADGSPGWLVLWRGWEKLHLMVAGARAARNAEKNQQKRRDP